MSVQMLGEDLPPPTNLPTMIPMIGVWCKMDESGEAVIVEVIEETPAAFSGQVSIGDVIEAVDGEAISSLEQLKSLIDGEENTLVMLELRRNRTLPVESLHLMRLAIPQHQKQGSEHKTAATPKAGMGARVVHDERGMKVCAMYEGSSAYWSKLKIGDLICAVDGHDIRHGPPSRVLALTSGDVGTSMTLLVIRKHDPTEDLPLGAVPVDNIPSGARAIWPGDEIPNLQPGDMLVQISVVRLQTLNGAALKRALSYRSQVVELLQRHIEDALRDTKSFGSISPTHISWADAHARRSESSREQGIKLSPRPTTAVMARPSGSHIQSHASPRTPMPSLNAAPLDSVPPRGESPQQEHEEVEKIVMEIQTRMEEHQRLLHDEAISLQGQIQDVAGMLRAQGRTSVSKEDSLAAFEQKVLGYIQVLQRRQETEKRDTLTLLQRHTQEALSQQQLLADEMMRQGERQQQQRAESMELHESLRRLTEKLTRLEAANGAVAPLSSPLTPPLTERAPPARPDTPVGVSLTIAADFDRVLPHESRFSQDLLAACAFCLQAAPARFAYCGMRRGSVVALLDILPDRTGTDPRTCRMLAGELANQIDHPHSPLRNTPVTKPATNALLHEPTGAKHTVETADAPGSHSAGTGAVRPSQAVRDNASESPAAARSDAVVASSTPGAQPLPPAASLAPRPPKALPALGGSQPPPPPPPPPPKPAAPGTSNKRGSEPGEVAGRAQSVPTGQSGATPPPSAISHSDSPGAARAPVRSPSAPRSYPSPRPPVTPAASPDQGALPSPRIPPFGAESSQTELPGGGGAEAGTAARLPSDDAGGSKCVSVGGGSATRGSFGSAAAGREGGTLGLKETGTPRVVSATPRGVYSVDENMDDKQESGLARTADAAAQEQVGEGEAAVAREGQSKGEEATRRRGKRGSGAGGRGDKPRRNERGWEGLIGTSSDEGGRSGRDSAREESQRAESRPDSRSERRGDDTEVLRKAKEFETETPSTHAPTHGAAIPPSQPPSPSASERPASATKSPPARHAASPRSARSWEPEREGGGNWQEANRRLEEMESVVTNLERSWERGRHAEPRSAASTARSRASEAGKTPGSQADYKGGMRREHLPSPSPSPSPSERSSSSEDADWVHRTSRQGRTPRSVGSAGGGGRVGSGGARSARKFLDMSLPAVVSVPENIAEWHDRRERRAERKTIEEALRRRAVVERERERAHRMLGRARERLGGGGGRGVGGGL